MKVESWLHRAARMRPDRPAVNAVTYAQLLARASAAATALPAGARVGLALPPGEAFAVAMHATFLAGALAVPIDLRLTPEERPPVDVLVDAPLPDDGGGRGSASHVVDAFDLDASAIVVHTSGTTSRPKPIHLTYGNWLWSAAGSGVALGVDPHERWLCTLPLSHVGGLSILLRSAIAATTALVLPRFDTDQVLALLRGAGGSAPATIVSLVPTTLTRLLDAGLEHPPALRWALLGGAPLPPALLARAAEAGVPVAPTYGLTEACSQVTTHGTPLFCTTVELAGDGEVLVSGPTVSPDVGGVLATGDLGAWDEDGALHIVGRKADTIITGGENVAPAEVEAVLEAHPAVLEAAVIGRAHPEWGQSVVALVRLRDDVPHELLPILDHCREHLARFKVPKELERVLDPLPRTASGKLVRRELRPL